MRYEDLPAKARAQVDAQLKRQPRKKTSRREATGDCPYRCVSCDTAFDKFSGKGGAEEHSRATGHVRQEMVLR